MTSLPKLPIAPLTPVLVILFLTSCITGPTAPTSTSVEVNATSTPLTNIVVLNTDTATPNPTPTPSNTPTPRFTITPNTPGIIEQVVYPKPPKQQGFVRPAAIIPSILKIVNETDASLMATLKGVSNAVPVGPGKSTEWQVSPGTYTYSIVANVGGLPFLEDQVTVKAGEIVTIVIDEQLVSNVVFINQTGLALTIDLPRAKKTFKLNAGQTSEPIPLPPGEYDFTAQALSASHQDKVTLTAGQTTEVTLIAKEVFGNSSLAVDNRTNFSIRLKVDGTTVSVTAGPGKRSQPAYLPPGTYTYSVCDTASGAACGTGAFTIRSGEDILVTIDAKVISASAVRFQNQTPYQLTIKIDGVTAGITVPAGGTSDAIDVLAGAYSYCASGDNVAPFCSSFTVAQGQELTVSLILGGSRATLTVHNDTDCVLTFDLSGPSTFTFTVPARGSKTVDIPDGSYSYTATACNASTSGSFSGSEEITFFLR